jgi:hypothetical protein
VIAIPWFVFAVENLLPRGHHQPGYVGDSMLDAGSVFLRVGTDQFDFEIHDACFAANCLPAVRVIAMGLTR